MNGQAVNNSSLNQQALMRAKKRNNVILMSPAIPAVLLVFITFILPIGWLFYLSLFDEQGSLSAINYIKLAEPIYLQTFIQTFKVSLMTTAICIVIGYPYAYIMARGPKYLSHICMVVLLTSLWTALLVRTYAWLILLQRRGVVNDLLLGSGLIDYPLSLVYNITGTVIGMTHIMLPYMVLPLYAAMKNINPVYRQVAATFGAGPSRSFRDIFLPLSLPGLAAGTTLVFVLCLGFYVTPTLLGGGRVQVISMRIESDISLYANWGAASSLGVVLLVITFALLFIVNRIFNLRQGSQ